MEELQEAVVYEKEFIMAFVLPDLPYAFDALEPIIDAKTMENPSWQASCGLWWQI